MTTIPRLTVRAFAEVLELPMHSMSRLLRDQKHPKEEPAVFRVPYYDPARVAVRRYFSGGNNPQILAAAAQNIKATASPKDRSDRAGNNIRALGAFGSSAFAKRNLNPTSKETWTATSSGLELRASFDLIAIEKGEKRYFFMHYGANPIGADLARSTIEAAHWVLEQAGEAVHIRQIQYLDLAKGDLHTARTRTKSFDKKLTEISVLVPPLWTSL